MELEELFDEDVELGYGINGTIQVTNNWTGVLNTRYRRTSPFGNIYYTDDGQDVDTGWRIADGERVYDRFGSCIGRIHPDTRRFERIGFMGSFASDRKSDGAPGPDPSMDGGSTPSSGGEVVRVNADFRIVSRGPLDQRQRLGLRLGWVGLLLSLCSVGIWFVTGFSWLSYFLSVGLLFVGGVCVVMAGRLDGESPPSGFADTVAYWFWNLAFPAFWAAVLPLGVFLCAGHAIMAIHGYHRTKEFWDAERGGYYEIGS